jgi:hypothetical protein
MRRALPPGMMPPGQMPGMPGQEDTQQAPRASGPYL